MAASLHASGAGVTGDMGPEAGSSVSNTGGAVDQLVFVDRIGRVVPQNGG